MAVNSGIEKPSYKLVKKYNNFELRDYGSIVIATTSLERNYSRSNSIGFQKVASYIFGSNDKNMKMGSLEKKFIFSELFQLSSDPPHTLGGEL